MVGKVQYGGFVGGCLIVYFQPVSAAETIGQADCQRAREAILPVGRYILQCQCAVSLAGYSPDVVGKAGIAPMRGDTLSVLL